MDSRAYIEKVIQEFDIVLFLPDGFKGPMEQNAFDHLALEDRKILVLSTKRYDFTEGCITHRVVSEEEAGQISRLYYTYEFTDNFIMLDGSGIYASIFDFVTSGILSAGEAWRALLM